MKRRQGLLFRGQFSRSPKYSTHSKILLLSNRFLKMSTEIKWRKRRKLDSDSRSKAVGIVRVRLSSTSKTHFSSDILLFWFPTPGGSTAFATVHLLRFVSCIYTTIPINIYIYIYLLNLYISEVRFAHATPFLSLLLRFLLFFVFFMGGRLELVLYLGLVESLFLLSWSFGIFSKSSSCAIFGKLNS